MVLILFAACSNEEPAPKGDDTDDGDEPVPVCVEAEKRTYDLATDPFAGGITDPVMNISGDDVHDAVLGSFTGTYTPEDGDAFSVDVAMSVDGLVEVQDYTEDSEDFDDDACPSVWSTTLVLAMSSERIADAYLIDDLWSPAFSLSELDAAELSGSKPAADFDGTLPASGDVDIEATFADDTWTGTLSFDGDVHGSFEVVAD